MSEEHPGLPSPTQELAAAPTPGPIASLHIQCVECSRLKLLSTFPTWPWPQVPVDPGHSAARPLAMAFLPPDWLGLAFRAPSCTCRSSSGLVRLRDSFTVTGVCLTGWHLDLEL